MIRKALALIFSFTFLLCIEASAQTVDELIKKNLDAKGGVQKLKAIKSVKASGKVIQQGIEIPIVIQQRRPGMARMDIIFQGKTMVPDLKSTPLTSRTV